MKMPWILVIVALVVSSVKLYGQIKLDHDVLQSLKYKVEEGDDLSISNVNSILRAADSIRKISYFPRVTNKALTPVSDDIHDYVSMATYYWPNPKTKNGLPYIRRDGKANPEVSKFNNYHNLIQICERVKILGLAYYYSRNDKYAKSASELINVFFLRHDTRMNPNMDHAQFIRGINNGRLTGIIEARFFVDLLDGVQLASKSPSFPNKYYKGLQDWFSNFLNWMESDKIIKESKKLHNNIGTSFHLQRMAYATFIGDKNKVQSIYRDDLKQLLKRQIMNDGKQHLELKRAQPVQYSIANLKYWFEIKKLLENNKLSLDAPDKERLNSALNYLMILDVENVNDYHSIMLQSLIHHNNISKDLNKHDRIKTLKNIQNNNTIDKVLIELGF